MHEQNETQLPLVESFGEQFGRAIAKRAGWRRRSRRRGLGLAFAAALVAASLLSAPGRAASGQVGAWLGLAEPGGPPTVDGPRPRGGLGIEPTGSVVLAAGRAPDGARYEFVLENLAEPAKSDPGTVAFRHCLNLEWPDARRGPISPQFGCHPTLPPPVGDKAAVKWQGAMFDPSYTANVQIAGVAGADVHDVRILYKDEHGAKRDAPVDFATVTGALRKRAGADRRFGVFIGFLPQAWLGYGARYDFRQCPPKANAYDSEAIEVIAYDERGRVIAREAGNNINSVSGRPYCR